MGLIDCIVIRLLPSQAMTSMKIEKDRPVNPGQCLMDQLTKVTRGDNLATDKEVGQDESPHSSEVSSTAEIPNLFRTLIPLTPKTMVSEDNDSHNGLEDCEWGSEILQKYPCPPLDDPQRHQEDAGNPDDKPQKMCAICLDEYGENLRRTLLFHFGSPSVTISACVFVLFFRSNMTCE